MRTLAALGLLVLFAGLIVAGAAASGVGRDGGNERQPDDDLG